MVCLFAGAGFSAEAPEQKQRTADITKKTKTDTSLYSYYQKHLKPYFQSSRPKEEEICNKEPSESTTSSGTPMGSLTLSRSKVNGADSDSAQQEADAEQTTYLTLNRIDSIGLDAINKTFANHYRKEYIAELALGVRLPRHTNLTFGKVQKFERYEDTPWETHDNGWMIRLKKDF
ncbi:MAG: hypothetical protein LBQ00_08800 [Syntrophobacterales bacterium]|jgi:hypothetical protein|nr:hypothetical protein [Syntrophobacterales bacterium]